MRKNAFAASVVCAVLFALASSAAAADVSITASVSPPSVPVGGQARLVVTVEGKFSRSSSPELPPLDDFTVYQAGTSQSYSFGTGGSSATLQFTYVLIPKKAGTYTIQPIRFQSGDKIYTASPVTLEVGASSGRTTAPESDARESLDLEGDQPIFVRAKVDRDTVYVNQQVTWTLGFYTDGRIDVLRTPEYSPPPAEGFWAEELPAQESSYRQVNGRKYLVNEVKRALFASAPGEYTIGQARVDIVIDDFGRGSRDRSFDDFFSRSFGGFGFGKPASLKTQEIKVAVLPLPSRGRPEGFTGLVGRDLEMTVQTDKQTAQVGEPINLVLEVRGNGNFKTMSAPALQPPDGFKMYESGTSSDLFKKDLVVSGAKKYEYVLVPQSEGRKTIRPVALSYFDPVEKAYRTIQSPPIALDIKPGAVEDGRKVVFAGAGEEIEVLGTDIRYIRPVPAVIRPSSGPFSGSALYWALHALPLVALLASIVVERRRRLLRGDVRLARATRAGRDALKKLGEAARLPGDHPADRAYAAVSAAVRGYLADKMNASPSGITADDIDRYLGGKGIPDDDIEKIRALLKMCDDARYAPPGSAGSGAEAARRSIEAGQDIVRMLEKRSLK
ncbi:MAG: hypothetical protein H6Q78_759 [Candidatus Krumholzibacteriota bacterium]|nr:hypothetical protein [Candidatus Krumholzibacteriota bacterium]